MSPSRGRITLSVAVMVALLTVTAPDAMAAGHSRPGISGVARASGGTNIAGHGLAKKRRTTKHGFVVPASSKCSKAGSARHGQYIVCIKFKGGRSTDPAPSIAEAQRSAARRLAARAHGATSPNTATGDGVVVLGSPIPQPQGCNDLVSSPSRFIACRSAWPGTVEVRDAETLELKGTQHFTIWEDWETETNSTTITHGFEIEMGSHDPGPYFAGGATVDVENPCMEGTAIMAVGTCSATAAFDGQALTGVTEGTFIGNLWSETIGLPDNSVYTDDVGAPGGPNLTLQMYPTYPPTPTDQPIVSLLPPQAPWRCDSQVGQYAGCVNPQYWPTIDFDATKLPALQAVATHMAHAQASAYPGAPPSGPDTQSGRPLHRWSSRAALNRAAVDCSSIPPGSTCDEYPFATTEEGGTGSGTAASTQGVPKLSNDTQGGVLSSGIQKYRILDGDPNPNGTYTGDPYYARAIVAAPSPSGSAEFQDAGCIANTFAANDDDSTASIGLPFSLNFYGHTYSSLYVNNNGNVTFTNPIWTYTPHPFDSGWAFPQIAPFWADVDTRGTGSGLVTYGTTTFGSRRAFCINWDNVGYFDSRTDMTNSFQLLLVDRSDIAPGDFDIIFNYGYINWETGEASDGVDGLGGKSAVAGFNAGDGNPAHTYNLLGSFQPGSFLNSNPVTGLMYNTIGSTTLGRYIFDVRNAPFLGGGGIDGLVQDSSFSAIANATVTACPEAGGGCLVGETDTAGYFSIADVQPGVWDITVNPPQNSLLLAGRAGPLSVGTGAVPFVYVTLGTPSGMPSNVTINQDSVKDGVPVIYGDSQHELGISACEGATVTYQLTQGSGIFASGPMTEESPGQYHASIPPVFAFGLASISISVNCPGGETDLLAFDLYIDPSGAVVDAHGNPVVGATVALYRADLASGPFVIVDPSSSILSPETRVNPQVTGADGAFHWNVSAGFYRVIASKSGCAGPGSTVTSSVIAVPPATNNLRLTLGIDCTPPSIAAAPETLVANTPGGYVGAIPVVTVSDPDDAVSTLTLTNDAVSPLPIGITTVTWTARDPAGNQVTAQQYITVIPEIRLIGTVHQGQTGSVNSNPPLVLNLPSGTAAGDEVVLSVTRPSGGTTVTASAGYTLIGSYTSANLLNNANLLVYRHTVAAGETTVSVTFSGGGVRTADLAVYRGVDTANPIDAISSAVSNSSTGTTITAPSITTTQIYDQLVVLDGQASTSADWTPPAGMTGDPTTTQYTLLQGKVSSMLAGVIQPTAGPSGAKTSTMSTAAHCATVLIAMRPA